jgi:hypothetical protein
MRGRFLWQFGKRGIDFREQRRRFKRFGNFARLLKVHPSFFTPLFYLAGKADAKADASGHRS